MFPPLSPAPRPSSLPTSARTAATSASSSASSSERVAELEARVASLERQQRLFLAFMENTQAQLSLVRGGAAVQAVAPATSAARGRPSAGSEASAARTRQAVGPMKEEEKRRVLDEQSSDDQDGDEEDEDEGEEEDEEEEKERYSDHRREPSPFALPPSSQSPSLSPPSARSSAPRSVQSVGGRSSDAGKRPLRSAPLDGGSGIAPSRTRTPSQSPPPSVRSAPLTTAAQSLDVEPYPVVETFPCPQCGRSFNEAALAKHVAKAVCQRSRKPFDVRAQRLGTVVHELKRVQGAADAVARTSAGGRTKERGSRWRQERARLQEAIQAGKAIEQALREGKSLASLPVAVSALPDERVQCPHCLRRFAESTAERHMPHCKEKTTRMPNAAHSRAANSATATLPRRR